MRRAGRTISMLTACGVCLAGAVGAVALAAPARGGPRIHGATHSRACRARTHARRPHPGHAQRCRRPAHRGGARVPRPGAGAPGTVVPAPGGGTVTAGAGAPPPAPPGSGSTSQTTESAPPAPPSVPHIQVIAVEYSLTLSRTTVPAGKVVVEFLNHGQDEHNLNFLAGEGPLAGFFPDIAAGGVSDQAIVLRAGTYRLFCSLPQHQQKGMRATLVVQ